MLKYKEGGFRLMRGRKKTKKYGRRRILTLSVRRRIFATLAVATVVIFGLVTVAGGALFSAVTLDVNAEGESMSMVDEVAAEDDARSTCVDGRDEEVVVETESEVLSELSELALIMDSKYYTGLTDAAGRLVLVDISEQRLWAFEDEKIVLESSVVTGMKDRHDTQLGSYKILLKRQDYTMRGSYGRVKVGYWMRFNDQYAQGLHDASWRSVFDGDQYVVNGSHGCVNLPQDFTADLYDFVEVGTPVIVQN